MSTDVMSSLDPQLSDKESACSEIKEEDEHGEDEEAMDEEETSADLEALKAELAKIVVTVPVIEEKDDYNPDDYIDEYKKNLPKEKLVLQFADNFRRQYVHLYRDRKPLLLNPINECGVEKFVSTTIRPTQLPYKELYSWEGASEFVADYLNIVFLEPPYELPQKLVSPTTILKRQKGNCFEYSTLLTSLLIGAGYDAYVVNGYATRELCNADETKDVCPLGNKKGESSKETKKNETKKYAVKPARDLQSKFETKMVKRKQDEIEVEEKKRKKDEEEKLAELDKPISDPLLGLRIHSWVLVIAGKREVPETFFIEPLTGLSSGINNDGYLGIESIWNHQNYWVCMQDCSQGVGAMSYDLGDCLKWEFMFASAEKPLLQIAYTDDDMMDDDDEEVEVEEKFIDMPPSWVEPIVISQKDFQMRCPMGKKTKFYKRAKLEKFAPYLMKDGLVSRLSTYSDKELKDLISVKEFYKNRADKLNSRFHNHRVGLVTEGFHPGRARALKEHTYRASAPGPESERTMMFHAEARVDGLVKRVESSTEMTEHFQDRQDFLFYRHVEYGKRPKKFGPQEGSSSTNIRPVLKMLQKFTRNSTKDANDDIAEILFLVSEDRIQVSYHIEDNRIASSTREFIKPSNWDEKGATMLMSSDMHTTFQVDPNTKNLKQVDQYLMLMNLLKEEEKCRDKILESEEEVREILTTRGKEEAASDLEISVYDTERNEKAKKHRQEQERLQQEEKMRKQEMELDYLAPFLAQIGDPERITRTEAYRLKEECLSNLKQRLIDKANLIQSRFEKETQELQKKQGWYQQNQVSMTKDDEEEYLNYCSEAMFRIHILELRLNRHKEMAPHKYMSTEQRLRSDPRLTDFF